MLLDLNFKFLDTENKEIPDSNPAKLVSDLLAYGKNEFDPIDAWEFAKELRKTGIIELKPTDFELFEKYIRETETLAPFAKAQILLAIKDAKNKKDSI